MICLFVTSCEKYESGQNNKGSGSKRMLNESDATLKENLQQAAKIMAGIIHQDEIVSELSLLYEDGRETYNLPFRDLLSEVKGADYQFKNLRERFLQESGSVKGYGDLISYLQKNDCYLYCPYPSSFYPRGTKEFTIAAHPIDNDIENVGYLVDGKKAIREVTVNEKYADDHPVILIMPKDETEDGLKGEGVKFEPGAKGDPVYEVQIGKIRCADYCGGLFEGELELRLIRGYPTLNPSTGELGGTFSTAIPIKYPKDYAKAAINNWTIYCEGGWFSVYIPWDSNWRLSKAQQIILAYEYDQVKEVTKSGTVGYKSDTSNITLTATVKTTYRGDFLGFIEWDRDWFYATNTNPGPYGEFKDGWAVRKTCPVLKLTTPARTIY